MQKSSNNGAESIEKGWVKLHRKLLDHPRFGDGPWLKLWMAILLRATHAPFRTIFDGKEIELQPGQLIASRDSLAKVCAESPSMMERRLKTLEIEQQIGQVGGRRNRLITVLAWEQHQKREQVSEHLSDNDRTSTGHLSDTNKNGKKGKEKAGLGNLELPHGEKFKTAWEDWTKHRKETKKPLTPTSAKAMLKKLGGMSERDAVAMIEHTVAMGWQGLRAPEQGNSSSKAAEQKYKAL